MAAGLVDVWSSIRLLIRRGCESKTLPDSCAYDVDGMMPLPGPKKSVGLGSAVRKIGLVSRGNAWLAAANVSRPGSRLLHCPSTVRRPYAVRASGIWSGAGPINDEQYSGSVAGFGLAGTPGSV